MVNKDYRFLSVFVTFRYIRTCIGPNQKYGLSAGRPKTARPKGKVRKGMSKTSEAEITLLESV